MLGYLAEALINAGMIALPFILVMLYLALCYGVDALATKSRRRRRARRIAQRAVQAFYDHI